MIAVKTVDLRNDFKRVSELVISGEKVLISRPHNQNLVVLSEKEYNELEKARRNAEYLDKIEKSRKNLENNETFTFAVDELFLMEDMSTAEMQNFAQKRKGRAI